MATSPYGNLFNLRNLHMNGPSAYGGAFQQQPQFPTAGPMMPVSNPVGSLGNFGMSSAIGPQPVGPQPGMPRAGQGGAFGSVPSPFQPMQPGGGYPGPVGPQPVMPPFGSGGYGGFDGGMGGLGGVHAAGPAMGFGGGNGNLSNLLMLQRMGMR